VASVRFKAADFRKPMNSQILKCRIEHAFGCDGLMCGIWNTLLPGEEPPEVGPHMHLVLWGEKPETSPFYMSCFERK
jgi:hypothetical protein